MKNLSGILLSLGLLVSSSAMADTLARAWWTGDQNDDGAYNYSTTSMSGGSTLNVANEWNDAEISFILTGPYGDTRMPSVKLYFEHNGTGHAEANLPTSVQAGLEPASFEDRDAGKAINLRNTKLIFTAPGFQNNVKVKLVDAAGHSSKALAIADYRGTYGRYWFDYQISVDAFQAEGFDYGAIRFVTFFVDETLPAGSYKLDLLSLNFVNVAPIVEPASARDWWKEDANLDGAYNYSTTFASGGTTINTANEWGDAAIGFFLSGPMGDTKIPSVNLKFHHNGQGYAEANLTSEGPNTGHEPKSFEDRDAGKAVPSTGVQLRLSGRGITAGVRVKLVDAYGHSSPAIEILPYQAAYGRYWFSYNLPIELFKTAEFDFNAVKSVTVLVDGGTPAGDYDVHIVGIAFN